MATTLQGFDKVFKELERGIKLDKHVGPAVRQVAENVFKDSQDRVPTDTGNLKNSGVLNEINSGPVLGQEIVYGGVAADYAGFIHDGTATHPANPFLADAVKAGAPALAPALKKAMG